MEITEEELKAKIAEAVKEATKSTFTQDDIDKAVSKRVNELSEKHKKDLEDEKAKAKMTAEELKAKEFDDLKKALAEKDAVLKKKEHLEAISKIMSEKKIDAELMDMFSGISDIEIAKTQMDKYAEKLKASVDAEVESKLKGHTPHTGVADPSSNLSMNNAIRAAAGYQS